MFYKEIAGNVASLIGKLNAFPFPSNTYLAGGTAVTLYLGHRISVDIDLFTDEHFFTGPIIDIIKSNNSVSLESVSEKDSFTAEVEGVKLSLFYYPYTLLEPLYNDEFYKISIASLEDIAAMKTVAIIQRGTAKDFVDLKAIMEKNSMPLDQLIDLTLAKYGTDKNYAYHIKRGLVFFDDAEKQLKEVTLLKNVSSPHPISKDEWDNVKRFFDEMVIK